MIQFVSTSVAKDDTSSEVEFTLHTQLAWVWIMAPGNENFLMLPWLEVWTVDRNHPELAGKWQAQLVVLQKWIKSNFSFSEASSCFHQKEGLVEWAFLGDSRTRGLLEYFVDSFFAEHQKINISRKAHHAFNVTYDALNVHLNFLWAPQVELGTQ